MNTDYLDFVHSAASREELAMRTFDYLKLIGKTPEALLHHRHRPEALTVIRSQEDTFSAKTWAKAARNSEIPAQPDFMVSGEKYVSFIGGAPPYRQPFYIFVFTAEPSQKIKEIMHSWQRIDMLTVKIENTVKEDLSVEWANLISQLLHDTSSLIQLVSKNETSAELDRRLNYQTSVQDKLLYYIRPIDIIRSPLPVKDLINHSLQMANIDHEKISLTLSDKVTDIVIDAETFAKAFNEIVRNALTAVEHRPEKISISVDIVQGHSPCLAYDWLKITIHDRGKGIISDFIEYISEPFFTTRKSEGHAGFGLTNAKKIIEAHEGQLSINSVPEEGTAVTFYLPVLSSDDYE